MSSHDTSAPAFCSRCERGDHGNHGHGGNGGCLTMACECTGPAPVPARRATTGDWKRIAPPSRELFVEPEDAFSRAFELNADEIHRAFAASQIVEGFEPSPLRRVAVLHIMRQRLDRDFREYISLGWRQE